MCCIFTCFGWMIDLIQRFWTFIMSCCISSAVCCLLVVASMAGIALGYNYSLAEYIDLKESNVSIFLKRGVFDDEIADLQLRRAGQEFMPNTHATKSRSAMLASEEALAFTDPPSRRRLDDSVFDGGAQHRYEGSLMRLTAKPPFEHTTLPPITADSEMGLIAGAYTKDSLDSLKAIQALIDSRRAYAQTIRGPTISPVPTYPFNEVERMTQLPALRRMMTDGPYTPSLSPARLAVPVPNIGSDLNWIAPLVKTPYHATLKDMGFEGHPTTFPSPITFMSGPIRPTPTMSTRGEGSLFLTNYKLPTYNRKSSDYSEEVPYTKDPRVLSFKEKLMAENDIPLPRRTRPPSDEEYDYDVKGLPVRKRRSINVKEIAFDNEPYGKQNQNNKINIFTGPLGNIKDSAPFEPLINNPLKINEVLGSNNSDNIQKQKQNVLPSLYEQNNTEQNNVSILHEADTSMKLKENNTFGIDSAEIPQIHSVDGSLYRNFFTHIKKILCETFQKAQINVTSKGTLSLNDNDQIKFSNNKINSSERSANFKSTAEINLTEEIKSNITRNFNHTDTIFKPTVLIKMASTTA